MRLRSTMTKRFAEAKSIIVRRPVHAPRESERTVVNLSRRIGERYEQADRIPTCMSGLGEIL